MTAKHGMTDDEYDVYTKIHRYDHPLDEEKSKIRREKTNSARFRRKGQAHLKQRLNTITRITDGDDWDDDPLLDAYEVMAEREIRNAHAHKRRLKKLAQYQDRSRRSDED